MSAVRKIRPSQLIQEPRFRARSCLRQTNFSPYRASLQRTPIHTPKLSSKLPTLASTLKPSKRRNGSRSPSPITRRIPKRAGCHSQLKRRALQLPKKKEHSQQTAKKHAPSVSLSRTTMDTFTSSYGGSSCLNRSSRHRYFESAAVATLDERLIAELPEGSTESLNRIQTPSTTNEPFEDQRESLNNSINEHMEKYALDSLNTAQQGRTLVIPRQPAKRVASSLQVTRIVRGLHASDSQEHIEVTHTPGPIRSVSPECSPKGGRRRDLLWPPQRNEPQPFDLDACQQVNKASVRASSVLRRAVNYSPLRLIDPKRTSRPQAYTRSNRETPTRMR